MPAKKTVKKAVKATKSVAKKRGAAPKSDVEKRLNRIEKFMIKEGYSKFIVCVPILEQEPDVLKPAFKNVSVLDMNHAGCQILNEAGAIRFQRQITGFSESEVTGIGEQQNIGEDQASSDKPNRKRKSPAKKRTAKSKK